MKNLFAVTLCLASLLGASYALAAKVYKWVDEDGVTHFSEHPPKNTQTTVIKPKIGHSEPVNYGTDGSLSTQHKPADTAAQQQADEAASQALRDPARCTAARQNKEILQSSARVKVKGEDGGFHFLTPEEQQQRLKSTQQAIDESC